VYKHEKKTRCLYHGVQTSECRVTRHFRYLIPSPFTLYRALAIGASFESKGFYFTLELHGARIEQHKKKPTIYNDGLACLKNSRLWIKLHYVNLDAIALKSV
jgi:hypothetical protein